MNHQDEAKNLMALVQNMTVEWKPLGKVAKFHRGKSLSKEDIGTGDTPIILYGQLYTTYGNYIDNIVSFCNAEKATQGLLVSKNDIIMPITSTTKDAQIGKASVLRVDIAYLGGDAVRITHNQNPGYLMHLLNSDFFNILKMKYRTGTTIS